MDVSQSTNLLDQPVSGLHGIGPERTQLLARLEIHTIRDLLLHRPRRYEDRRNFCPIKDLSIGAPVLTCGKVVACGTKLFARRSKSVTEVILSDGDSNARLYCRWWNMAYMERYFHVGDEVVVFGKVLKLKPRTMDHPEVESVDKGPDERVHMGRIVPVYPLTEGLSQRWLRGVIWRTLQELEDGLFNAESIAPQMAQPPSPALALSYGAAIRLMHMPEHPADQERARRRLALEEFLHFQRQLQKRRKLFKSKSKALPCRGDNHLIRPLLKQIGFALTGAQTRVLREIRGDMGVAHPMRRLLQGDVGSGKTLVAFCTALMALESKHSVALMAPTEILAEQHYRTATKWLVPLGVKAHLLTGSRKTIHADGTAQETALYIGTHALLESGFVPSDLGLVIIDEQHKFGVSQREELLRKGHYPHLLVMTATPIPRTLGLTLYGDLEVSTIDEMPPGRGRIRTFIRSQAALDKVWTFIKTQFDAGRQAYIIYPRIVETAGNVKAVTMEHEQVRKALAPHGVAMLHGRMAPAEKESVMSGFVKGETRALLATSLIEVGVDVPNATVMVIENAEQFGLAQLHQLRGRIGRGAHESYCVLLTSPRNKDSEERLKILEQSHDGFQIAEADLLLRGPGELLGQDQSGVPSFRFGDLRADLELLREARTITMAAAPSAV